MKKARKNASRRTRKKFEPRLPLSVVTRDGKTVTRQFDGRRFVRFGDVRGKRVACVEFFTAGGETHEINVRFQDRTVFHFEITPSFALKPELYSLRTGDVETIKVWPEMRTEQ